MVEHGAHSNLMEGVFDICKIWSCGYTVGSVSTAGTLEAEADAGIQT